MTAATPGQADAPAMYARYIRAYMPPGAELTEADVASRWEHLTGLEQRLFWLDLDAAQGARPAPSLSAGLADLESELRDVTRQVALCRSTKIPCVACDQEITRAMGAVRRWAQDIAEHERTREPKPAPELAAAMRETRHYRELVENILAVIDRNPAAIKALTGPVVRAWRKRGLPS